MELSAVKNYLRIDFDDDDLFLKMSIAAAEAYLEAAIDDYEQKLKNKKFKSKADICLLALVQNMYDNRMLIDKDSRDLSYTIRSMISQLQYGKCEVE